MEYPFPQAFTQDWAERAVMIEQLSKIQGNVGKETKHVCLAVFKFFINKQGRSYGAGVGEKIRMVGLNIWGDTEATLKEKIKPAFAEAVFELTVSNEMCNVFHTLHGACAVYIMDPCSVAPLVLLGLKSGIDGTGLSQSMNLIWHSPARLGRTLRIVATSVSIKGRIRTARCEIWDENVLCVSATHSTVNPIQKAARSNFDGLAKL